MQYLHTNDINQEARQSLLFLHAFPFDSGMWKDQWMHFSKNFRCLSPDLPGFGESALPDFPVTFEHSIDALEKLLLAKGIEKSIWIGLSMGGYAALRLHERRPDLCAGLILCDTKFNADTNEGKLNRWKALQELHRDRDGFFESQWKNLFSEHSRGDLELKESYRTLTHRQSSAAIAQGLVSLATRTDTGEKLNQIKVPTLILVGAEDKVTPLKDAQHLQQKIAGARLEIVDKAGHLSNLENPVRFNQLVEVFLKSL